MAHGKVYKQIMNSRAWRELRDWKRVESPWCEECMKKGIVKPMWAVHHIREIESGKSEAEQWALALSRNNLQSLCSECHKDAHIGSHTRQAHRIRSDDRLAAWKQAVKGDPRA